MRHAAISMLDAVEELVSVESPSSDPSSLQKCADVVAGLCERIVGATPDVADGDHPRVRLSFGEPRVVLIGHFDTVWPLGTLGRWPFSVADGIATGPGIFDMKAGIVQGLFALASLDDRDGITMLLTSDEELGSPHSQPVIEDLGRQAESVLVLEPSERGALKIARKGYSNFRLTFTGVASHAGLDPHSGRNAISALARAVPRVEAVAHGETTVVPTLAKAGSASNTVPASAELIVDSRAETVAEQDRVDAELKAITSQVEGVTVHIERTSIRPPLERSASAALFARANEVASRLGIGALDGVAVGGGSDGNLTAAVGAPTLDGLGAVGGGAHAEGEHIVVEKMQERMRLVAALIEELQKTTGDAGGGAERTRRKGAGT